MVLRLMERYLIWSSSCYVNETTLSKVNVLSSIWDNLLQEDMLLLCMLCESHAIETSLMFKLACLGKFIHIIRFIISMSRTNTIYCFESTHVYLKGLNEINMCKGTYCNSYRVLLKQLWLHISNKMMVYLPVVINYCIIKWKDKIINVISL